MDPCPSCGELLVAPADEPSAGNKRFPTVDTSMQTQIAGDETPPPGESEENRAATATGDDVHSLPTVADVAAPDLEAMKGTPADTEEEPASDALVEDTQTETTPSPPDMSLTEDTSEASPFSGDSVDQENEQNQARKLPRAESPDVLTRTIAEEHVARQEAAAPSPDSLPPLPVPKTPKPALPPLPKSAGAPPLPRSSSNLPRPSKPSGAPPIPGAVAVAANRSGVVSSAPVMPSPAPAVPAAAPPPPVQQVASQSGVMSSAPPIAAMAPAAAAPTPASGRPSDVLPRPPAAGRPSDVLPRPPASAVVRPGVPPGVGSPAPPSAMQNQMPPGMVASPAPGAQPPMMQSFPTPSNLARPPAPGMMQSPPPQRSDESMSAMPAAYALPGSGYPAGGGPIANTPNPPLVHTPIPPGLIGPPPDLNESPNFGSEFDMQNPVSDRARQDTPSNAVWRTAHPSAQKWAAKRHGGSVRTPKPGIIALGLMLAGFGAYLLMIFLPTKRPLTAAMKEELSKQAGVDQAAWHFSEQLIGAANINAALFVLLGVVIVLRGLMYRQQPAGHARRGFSKPALMLIFCFVLLAVSFGALLMSASA